MSIPGLCAVCGKPATNTCRLCGRVFCEMHFDASAGVCVACKGKGVWKENLGSSYLTKPKKVPSALTLFQTRKSQPFR